MEVDEAGGRRLLLHCAKHSANEVTGVFVRLRERTHVVPLFHSRVMAPLLEVALQLIGGELQGFYQGCIKSGDEVVRPAKWLESFCQKVLETSKQRLYVVCVDSESNPFFRNYRWDSGGFRLCNEVQLAGSWETLEAKEVWDMDDHFEDCSKDWNNPQLD